MFKRTIEDRLPKGSFFLFGPRQVGKSTVLSCLPCLLKLDLLSAKEQLLYSRNPEHLLERLDAVPRKEGTVILDEVQKVPALLDVVHQGIEKYPHCRFILCGSSARKLRHGAANLLGGRAAVRTLHPLTQMELGDAFNLNEALAFGTLPPVYNRLLERDFQGVVDLLEGYVITYIKEEVKAEALVRNLQGFQNFIDVAAASFGQQVNFLDISRQCQVAYATVREYYTILEDTLLGFFLCPYIKSVRRRMSHQSKFYFFDNGVTRALMGSQGQSSLSPLERGRYFEQWCMQEVVRLNAYYNRGLKFFFWRTADGAEVDLLIQEGERLKWAVEFKAKERITGTDLRGLDSFHKVYPNVKRLVVGMVSHKYNVDEIPIVPLMEFLSILLEK